MFIAKNDIRLAITDHYVQSWRVAWTTQVIAKSDLPILSSIGTISLGVGSFFMEPVKGAQKDGVLGFGIGIAKGAGKLVAGTLDGVIGGVSVGLGNLGGVTAKITGDKDFQKKRKKEMAQENKPKNVAEGVGKGVKGLGQSLFHGITGIVTQPIEGAKREGAVGAVKGIGKGLVGVVARPVTGVLDLVSQTTEGVRNTGRFLINDEKLRIRPPRMIGKDRIVRSFDLHSAHGQELLVTLESGVYANQYYVYHAPVTKGGDFLLISSEQIFLLTKNITPLDEEDYNITWTAFRVHSDIRVNDSSVALKTFSQDWEQVERVIYSPNAKDVVANLKHLIIPKSASCANLIFPSLYSYTLKFGVLEHCTPLKKTWNQVFAILENGILKLIGIDNNSLYMTINVKTSPCGLQAIPKRHNRFVLLVQDQANYFKAPTQREKLEWIHVFLLNGSYLAENYQVPKKIRCVAIQTHHLKFVAFSNMNHTVVTVDIGKDKRMPLIKFFSIDPEKCYLMINSYFVSLDSHKQLVTRTKDVAFATVFHIVKTSIHGFALKTEDGQVVTIQSNQLVVSKSTFISPLETLMEVTPPSAILIVLNRSFLTVNKQNLQVTTNFTKISQHEKFVLNRIVKNQYAIKSAATGKYLSLSSDGKSLSVSKDLITTCEAFYLERLPSGLYWIKTVTGMFIQIDRTGCFIGNNKPSTENGEFHIVKLTFDIQ
uniref:Intermembrane lipid transfer protein VPS13-like C-terminal domain-containing protein n=1 Tax=Arcella intermedia TaxID=1963864 RepID=A0A6B2KYM8_9EUKA